MLRSQVSKTINITSPSPNLHPAPQRTSTSEPDSTILVTTFKIEVVAYQISQLLQSEFQFQDLSTTIHTNNWVTRGPPVHRLERVVVFAHNGGFSRLPTHPGTKMVSKTNHASRKQFRLFSKAMKRTANSNLAKPADPPRDGDDDRSGPWEPAGPVLHPMCGVQAADTVGKTWQD